LSACKTRARKRVDKGEDFSQIQKVWPLITEEEWEIFKESCAQAKTRDAREWGKEMWALNIGNHNLRSRCYYGKSPKWEKEDALLRAAGKTSPFDEFTNPQARDFIRARYHTDRKTGELVTDSRTAYVVTELVINLPSYLLIKSITF
jgi:hypothetical protein